MLLQNLSTILTSLLAVAEAQVIFHGTSVVVIPDLGGRMANSTFFTANFFTYVTPKAYLSFGWFLPANGTTRHENCTADSRNIDWYEIGHGGCNLGQGCRFNATNVPVSRRSVNPFPVPDSFEYVVRLVDAGNGHWGKFALSYIDLERNGVFEGGGFGVGTRKILTQVPSEQENCMISVSTFRWVVKTYHARFEHHIIDSLCTARGPRSRQMWPLVGQTLMGLR